MWGEEGYRGNQVAHPAEFEVWRGFRALKSIDPESFGPIPSTLGGDEQVPSGRHKNLDKNLEDLTPPGTGISEADSAKTRWDRRLSPSDPQALRRRRRPPPPLSIPGEAATPEERAQLAQWALQHMLGPGTKFKWSLSRKEEI